MAVRSSYRSKISFGSSSRKKKPLPEIELRKPSAESETKPSRKGVRDTFSSLASSASFSLSPGRKKWVTAFLRRLLGQIFRRYQRWRLCLG